MEKDSDVSMRVLIAAVAGPQQYSDNRKSWLARAARIAGLSYRSVKAVFYSEINDPNHPTVRLLRHVAERRARVDADARKEAVETFRRLLALRDALAAKDAAFHQPEIDALERALDRMVGDAGAGDIHRTQE